MVGTSPHGNARCAVSAVDHGRWNAGKSSLAAPGKLSWPQSASRRGKRIRDTLPRTKARDLGRDGARCVPLASLLSTLIGAYFAGDVYTYARSAGIGG